MVLCAAMSRCSFSVYSLMNRCLVPLWLPFLLAVSVERLMIKRALLKVRDKLHTRESVNENCIAILCTVSIQKKEDFTYQSCQSSTFDSQSAHLKKTQRILNSSQLFWYKRSYGAKVLCNEGVVGNCIWQTVSIFRRKNSRSFIFSDIEYRYVSI